MNFPKRNDEALSFLFYNQWKSSSSPEKASGLENIDPSEIRFSQTSVNGSDEIIASMKAKGWKGDPIDVVRMPDGSLTTLDNTIEYINISPTKKTFRC